MSSGSPSNGGGSDLEEGYISEIEEKKDLEKPVIPIEQVACVVLTLTLTDFLGIITTNIDSNSVNLPP